MSNRDWSQGNIYNSRKASPKTQCQTRFIFLNYKKNNNKPQNYIIPTPTMQHIMRCSEMSKNFLLIQFIFIVFSSGSFKSLWLFPSFHIVTVIKHIKQFIKQQPHWPQGVLQLTFIRQLATLFKQKRAPECKTQLFVFQEEPVAHLGSTVSAFHKL